MPTFSLKQKVPEIKAKFKSFLLDTKQHPNWQAIVFALIIAGIGGYLIYHSFALTPLPTPTDLTETALPDGTVNLSWTASSDQGVTSYKIYQVVASNPDDSSGAGSTSTYIGTTDQTNYQVAGLEAGDTYNFYVVAVDPSGSASAPSNQVMAQTSLSASSQAALTTNIDYNSQSAVNSAYWKLWAPAQSIDAGWTGNVKNCDAGSMSASARQAEVDAINFARRLEQLAPIRATNSTANSNDMKAALIMQANNNLSHYPPSSWKCWSKTGALAAGESNLSLGPGNVGGHVAGFMDDNLQDSGGDTFVGHRRWLSLPEASVFGIGTTGDASAVQVIGLRTSGSNPSPNVMWPTRGYFPSTLAPGYFDCYPTYYQGCRTTGIWSYSAGSLNISIQHATVRVTHNGLSVAIKRFTPTEGYGRDTLTWAMPKSYETTGDYIVTIKKIYNTHTHKYSSKSYTVHFFDPVEAKLKLVKQVNNNYGGFKTPHDWTLIAKGAGGFSDTGDSNSFHNVAADVKYTLSESSIAGYAAGSWSCDGGNQNGNEVTLKFGQNVTCTIVNNDIAPTLTIIKDVVNSHGGTKLANDFIIKVNNVQLSGGILSNSNLTDTYTYNNLMSNYTYYVSENQLAGYTQTSLSCVDSDTHAAVAYPIHLHLGQNVTCTLTNSDQ